MNPSNFAKVFPVCSEAGSVECEEVAVEIVKILGDEWREITFDEYFAKQTISNFEPSARRRFDAVVKYTVNEELARQFASVWRNIERVLERQYERFGKSD